MANSKESRVEIVHDAVGNHVKGAIVKASVFGDELPRLIDMGAVREVDADHDWERPAHFAT